MQPKTGLHVTSAENLNSILSCGIKPEIGERSRATGESRPRVYFFPSREACDTALSTWLGDAFEDVVEEDGLVILEVDLAGLRIESDAPFELAVAEVIEPTRIISVMDESWAEFAGEFPRIELA